MTNILQEHNLYGNCEMYSPDDVLMFRCQMKKINWYVSRGLAEIFEEKENSSVKARFLFEPKGLGNDGDEFSLEEQVNQCSVCGDEEDLTRHHIVPSCYRKHFPLENKSHYHHDIVVICRTCHNSYEEVAFQVKQDLAIQYNAPLSVNHSNDFKIDWRISGTAYAYRNRRIDTPQDVLDRWDNELDTYLGRKFTEDDIDILMDLKEALKDIIRNHGKMVVGSVDLQEFVEMWREHFIEISQPKFMSEHWDIKRSV